MRKRYGSEGTRYSDYMVEGALLVVLAASIALFGSVEVWAWTAIAITIAAIALVVIVLKLIRGALTIYWTGLVLVAAAVLAYAFVQLVPMPARVMEKIAPGTLAHYVSLGHETGRLPLSLARYATKGMLLGLFSLLLFFVLLLVTLKHRGSVKRIMGLVIAIAFVAAILGILQSESKVERVYFFRDYRGPNTNWLNGWRDPLESAGYGYIAVHEMAGNVVWLDVEPVVGDIFGPFVSSNHFGAFAAVALTLGFAFVVLWMRQLGVFTPGRRGLLTSGEGNALCLTVFVLFAIGWGVVVSKARGGGLAGLAGMSIVLILAGAKGLVRFRWVIGLLLVFVLVALFGLALEMGWPRVPMTDLRSFLAGEIETRVEVWRSAIGRAGPFWLWGTGLGTFGSLNVSYGDTGRIAFFAHNELLQWFIETGLIGSILAAVLVVWTCVVLLGGVWRSRSHEITMLLCGVIGALAALVVSGAADYAVRVYGVARVGVALVACGVTLSGHARMEAARADGEGAEEPAERGTLMGKKVVRRRAVIGVILIVASGVLGGYGFLTYRHLRAELLWRPMRKVLASKNQRDIIVRGRLNQKPATIDMKNNAEKARRLEPWGGRFADDLAQYAMLAGQRQGDVEELHGSSAYHPVAVTRALESLGVTAGNEWANAFPRITQFTIRTLDDDPGERLAAFEEGMGAYGKLGSVYLVAMELAIAAKDRRKAAEYGAEVIKRQRRLLPKVLPHLVAGRLGDVKEFVMGLPDDADLLADLASRVGKPVDVSTQREIKARAYEVVMKQVAEELPNTTLTLPCARLAVEVGKIEEGVAAYKQYLRFHEEDVQARIEMAESLFEMEQYVRVRDQLKIILAAKSRNDRARALQARVRAYIEYD